MTPTKPPWQRAILESPYAGEVETHRIYALACLRDMLNRNEAAFVSHLLYPRVMTKYDYRERERGIRAGHTWMPVAQKVVLYTDLGVSSGMEQGADLARALGVEVLKRKLGWKRV